MRIVASKAEAGCRTPKAVAQLRRFGNLARWARRSLALPFCLRIDLLVGRRSAEPVVSPLHYSISDWRIVILRLSRKFRACSASAGLPWSK
jgi:hypothetical protein